MEGLKAGKGQKLEVKVARSIPVEGKSRRSQGSRWTVVLRGSRKKRPFTKAPLDDSAKQMGSGPTGRVKYRQNKG
jgi:hypothetical protein